MQPNGAVTATPVGFAARINPDGTLDTGFKPDANAPVTAFGIQPNGQILLSGLFTTLEPNAGTGVFARASLARIQFRRLGGPGLRSQSERQRQRPPGAVPTAASMSAAASPPSAPAQVNHLALFTSGATVNTGFSPQAASLSGATVNAIAVQPNSQVILGGAFSGLAGATGTNVVPS